MKTRILTFSLLTVMLLALESCKEDEVQSAKNRDVTFEVSGKFSGTVQVTYTTSNGGATSESISALPWSKSILYQSSVSGTAITLGGGSGIAGQTLLLTVIAGGKVVSETSGVTNSSGVVVISSPTYLF